jgi:prepilin-type N-terminal cleavage/methylation domain-containing protein
MIDNERGFSLPEILVAAGLIAIGFVALLRVVPMAAGNLQQGNQQSTATQIAQQRLEQAHAAVWMSSMDCVGVSTGAAAPKPTAGTSCDALLSETYDGNFTFPDEASVPGFPGYARTTRITDCGAAGVPCSGTDYTSVPGTPAPRLVTVTVTYEGSATQGATSRTRTVRLEWLVAQQ